MFKTIQNFFTLLRIKHWVKNCFIFFPIFFAGKIERILSFEFLHLFFTFCIASSIIYVLNDIIDRKKDANHPIKKRRPLASGFFTIQTAIFILVILAGIFITVTDFNAPSTLFVLGYILLNFCYSFFLKNIALVDVSAISLGYVLRVFAGASIDTTFVSHWMIIIVFLVTISISFAKRRDDLVLEIDGELIRTSLNGYTIEFLDIVKSISFTITLIAYILYSISPEVILRIGSDKLYLTSFFVFLGILRYLQLSMVDKKSGSPIDLLFKDLFLQLTILAWILTFSIILYGKSF